ncbi:MAG: glycosyltransferase family 2 protein, partial [Bdellovibrionia bacterium]
MESRAPDLSLLVPIYNEAGHLPGVLDQLLSVKWNCTVELVLIDDCSKDNSFQVMNTWVSENQEALKTNGITVQIEKLPVNGGKGGAIHKAVELARGKVLIVQDSDFEYDPNEVPALVAPILANRADVVYGSRFKKTSRQVHRTFHYLANRILTALSNLFSGIYLTDMET